MRQERLSAMTRIIRERRSMSVSALMREFDISYPTLRRDLSVLAARGVIKRVRGGAVIHEGLGTGPSWFRYLDAKHRSKVRMGEVAAKLVKPRQTVIIENGGTTLEVARALLRVADLVVVTNSLEISYLLNIYGKCRQVILTGGILRSDSYLYGPLTIATLEQFSADLAFVGANSVSLEHGIMDSDLMYSHIKRTIIRSAKKAILVADYSKFKREDTIVVEPLNALDTIVTTDEISEETRNAIIARNINLLIA
ncbi:MAG TPA: DeoR/GlpR transcriptional regulator [Firmicutes bacterium]|nr:DeoR/GlpR transcriptional regulator [Bacillota bacterium]